MGCSMASGNDCGLLFVFLMMLNDDDEAFPFLVTKELTVHRAAKTAGIGYPTFILKS
jgi:hypothetical protein